jgi:hypothetical protein
MALFYISIFFTFGIAAIISYLQKAKPIFIVIFTIPFLAGAYGLGVEIEKQEVKEREYYQSKCQLCKEIKGCDTKIYCNNY